MHYIYHMKVAIVDSFIPSLTLTTHWLKSQSDKNFFFAAENGQHFLLQLNKQKGLPDIVIADIRMRIMDGCSLAYYIKFHHPQIKLIAFSGYLEPLVISNAFVSGFDAYVSKSDGWEMALEEAIDRVTDNYCHLDTRLEKEMDAQAFKTILNKREIFWKSIYEDEDEYYVSKREKTFIILNATAMSYKEIAEVMHVDKRTIETMYSRISKKIRVTSNKELALFAIQNGMATQSNFTFFEEQLKAG